MIHAGSLPLVGSAVGVACERGIGRRVRRLLAVLADEGGRGLTRVEHGAQLQLRGCLDPLAGLLVGRAGDLDDDVLAALRRHIGLADAGGVDALADDRDGLVHLLGRGRRTVGGLRLEDDLRAALEVERELRGPRALP